MGNISDLGSWIKPTGSYDYQDRIRFWLKTPLSKADEIRLRAMCDHLDLRDRRARFDHRYIQLVTATRPSEAFLTMLKDRENLLLNYVEFSRDFIFQTEQECEAAFAFAIEHYIIKHRHGQRARLYIGKKSTSAYSGPRAATQVLALYADQPCRMTGEAHCLHFDWRISRVQTLRRLGIDGISDLLAFNQTAFLNERLIFGCLNAEHIGRAMANSQRKKGETQRRKSNIISKPLPSGRAFQYNEDLRRGQVLCRNAGITSDKYVVRGKGAESDQGIEPRLLTMNMIDALRSRIPMMRYLIKLDVFEAVGDACGDMCGARLNGGAKLNEQEYVQAYRKAKLNVRP